MPTFDRILGATYSAYAVRVGLGPSGARTAGDRSGAAIIRELVRGNIAGIRRTASQANTAVSMLQKFDSAAGAIGERLSAMQRLARRAAKSCCTPDDKADLQQQLQALAGGINSIVQAAEHQGNKLFTSEGETISIHLGNKTTIHVFARDLSIDTAALDLETDAAGALARIRSAMANQAQLHDDLERRKRRLEQAMAVLERDFAEALDVSANDFGLTQAKETANQIARISLDDPSHLVEIQANIIPAQAGRLLQYTAQA